MNDSKKYEWKPGIQLLSGIDDELVSEALSPAPRKRARLGLLYAAAAVILVSAAALTLAHFIKKPNGGVEAMIPIPHGQSATAEPAAPTNPTETLPPTVPSPTDAPDGPVKVIGFDWPYYENAEEIISASSNVYTGVVTDISFEIINDKNGEVDRSQDPFEPRTLYTVYTVSTVLYYKGNQTETHIIRVTGGPKGYMEDEQNDLLVSAGMVEPGGSIVYSGVRTDVLEIGKEYLFCTVSFDIVPDAEYEINPSQFALELASDEAKSIVKSFK